MVRLCEKEEQSDKGNPTFIRDINCVTLDLSQVTVSPVHIFRRLPEEHHEDVYLQCDSEPDAIYSNDPACDLSSLPGRHEEEEDVYIVPDS